MWTAEPQLLVGLIVMTISSIVTNVVHFLVLGSLDFNQSRALLLPVMSLVKKTQVLLIINALSMKSIGICIFGVLNQGTSLNITSLNRTFSHCHRFSRNRTTQLKQKGEFSLIVTSNNVASLKITKILGPRRPNLARTV